MIRFACPGCNAAFSVGDEKGGKAGKCPKCGSSFQIPMPEGEAAPPPAAVAEPPAPTPMSSNIPVEIAPCPSCGMRLTVGEADLGASVQCPGCQTVFQAARPGAAPTPPAGAVDVFGGVESGGSSKKERRSVDDEDEERPSRRSRRRDEDDEDLHEDRPRRKKKSRSGEESKRITAGILALLCGGLGVHKFYLGYTTAGVIQIILSCFCMGGIIAMIEGIIYLTKSDEEFIETYQVGEKQWF